MPTPMQSERGTRRPRPSRRAVLGAALAAALVPGLPARAAMTTETARKLIDQVVADINRVINSGMSEQQMYREFERIFAKWGDVPIIARRVLGPDWRRASPAQRKAFIAAFRRYMAVKYGKRFREFIGGRIEVTGVRKIKSFYEVISVAHLPGEAPFEVRWLVSDKSGRPLMFNLFIEGVNMLSTEAAEIRAMLDARGGNLDRLIADLRATK